MNCEDFHKHLDDYADGLLDAELHARMNAHAVDCAECAEVLKQTLEIMAALGDLEDEAPVPASVTAAWQRAVRLEADKKRRTNAWHGWRTFAAVAAAFAVWVGATTVMDDAGLLHAPAAQGQEYVSDHGLRYIETQPGSPAQTSENAVMTAAYLVSDGETAMSSRNAAATESLPADAAGTDAALQPMRILSARSEIVAQDLDMALANLDDLVSEMDGYYQLESETEENGVRRALRTIRVPVESLDEFLAGLKELGTEVHHERLEQDIAQNYYNADARIASLTLQRDQYTALIAQAATADEVADLAAKAEEIQLQIDALEGEKRTWDAALQYATVEVSLGTQATDAELSLGARMGAALHKALDFGKNMLVSLAYLAPGILVLAAVTFALVKVQRKKKK